ncbi:MAG TPA: LacI family DNA-binding transcriptional regulator [Chthonomonadaceae bacterium]|nr:LacI family DNA-binding transcriptional regulator [Chthonomonadaceae bacterium]
MVKRISTAREPGKSVTMRDIAALVGVSQATVSYVLNAHPQARVSPDTRQRVLEAANRLHYRPNAIARAMASGRSRTIGVYQPHVIESPLMGMWSVAVTRGIGMALHARQLHLLLYGYRAEEDPTPAAFLDGSVDGLIILAPHLSDALPGLLAGAGFPTVIVGGHERAEEATFSIDVDNVAGGRLATEHLLRLGHRRIAHLQGPSDVPNAIDRRIGYEEALRAHNVPMRPEYLIPAGFAVAEGYQAARAALCLEPRPTALLAANDLAALGALNACADAGVRVPEEMAVVGYDDAPICELARPTLTTLRQPAQEMGRAAAEILCAVLDGKPPSERRRLFPAELVVRESCGGRRA